LFTGAGADVFINEKLSLTHTESGPAKSVLILPGLIKLFFLIVSVQPCGLAAISITEYVPLLT